MSRIIAGARRGHRLSTPDGNSTRPTSDRVREAFFSALSVWAGRAGEAPAEELAGMRFCDLYAGSGAVGLEAASRGAAAVTCVESDQRAVRIIRRNAAKVDLAVSVVAGKVEAFLSSPATEGFDLIWLDPPYALAADRLTRVLGLIPEGGWLAPHGLVVVERSTRDPAVAWPESLSDNWNRRYGETTLYFGTEGAV